MANEIETVEVDVYKEICKVIEESRQHAYRAVNSSILVCYWSIGKIIVEYEQKGNAKAEYGGKVLYNLGEKLKQEYGVGFDRTNLNRMRIFYLTYPIRDALRHELTWTHYRLLLKIQNKDARQWYEQECINEHWSSRQLERQINSMYYDRLLASRDKEPVISEAKAFVKTVKPENFIKDPMVLEFLDLKEYPALRESVLEQALIDNLQKFLLELGRGFCFVARQKMLRYEDETFYIDLVFYHSILKCYVLIDLKIGKLTHEDVGQMDSYIRLFDDVYKAADDNPTIGIILCSEKNEAIVKYSVLKDAKQMFATKYQFTLPTVEELQRYLETERNTLETEQRA